jgi:sugar lactone lactonase YvrE
MRLTRQIITAVATGAVLTAWAAGPAQAAAPSSFIGQFHTLSVVGSTVPGDGDVNPYGVAVVGQSQGKLVGGDVLVSNFNDVANVQGTGKTIVQVAPSGAVSVFAHISPGHLPGACPGGIGLTTALDILPGGYVVVGSLPTSHGGTMFTGPGCLLVLNSGGRIVETISGNGLNGPWDMTAAQFGPFTELFVTNVLNGTAAAAGKVVYRGTVQRLILVSSSDGPPRLVSSSRIGSGFAEQTNPAALVLGPTGLGLGPDGTLYVADTVANRIGAIPDAALRTNDDGHGLTLTRRGALNAPLGLCLAPNGDVLSVNGNNGKIVETTPDGRQLATAQLDSSGSPPGAGALFGLAVAPGGSGLYYVDDATNTLDLLH